MKDQLRCPKCGGFVYAEHHLGKWLLRCCQCNLHTDTVDSHDTARKAWNKMVEPQESNDKCKNCEYYRNPDYTRCHECKAESEDKE